MHRVEIVLRPLLDEIDSLSIRILKSAIYHYFRCQIASTLTTPKSAASKLNSKPEKLRVLTKVLVPSRRKNQDSLERR